MSHICKECGKLENRNYYDDIKKDLEEQQLCFNCNFWTKRLNINVIIIDGECYVNGGRLRSCDPKGHGGRKFKIKKGDEEIVTENLWHNGTVPEIFRDRLPDNAKFISEKKITLK